MTQYVARRVLLIPLLLFAMSVLLFTLIQIAPGDPASILAPEGSLDPEVRERIIRSMGLDKPAPVQYMLWLGNWVQGDWGYSFSMGTSVRDAIAAALPVTLELQGLAILLSLTVSIPVGILSAVRKYSLFDNVATVFSLLGISLPDFWLGLTLMMVFAVGLGWLPSTGMGEGEPLLSRARYFLMPVVVLAAAQLASFTRFTRSSMLDVLTENYVITARAKGLLERVVLYRHALKNALIPVVTIVSLALVRMLGGAVIVESVFGWPGIGRMALRAVTARDAMLIMGITMVTALIVMLLNLITDVVYVFLDPRISFEGGKS